MRIRTRMMPTINTHMMQLKRPASRTRIRTSMNVCGTVIRMSLTCIMRIGTDARDRSSEQLHDSPQIQPTLATGRYPPSAISLALSVRMNIRPWATMGAM